MRCVRPLEGYRAPGGRFTYDVKQSVAGQHLTLRCGRCINCRLLRSSQWAARMIHELKEPPRFPSSHARAGEYMVEPGVGSFITLTYDDGSLPIGGTLVKSHFQDFMKRLRSRLDPIRIRFFHCGEYGEVSGRPHYHAVIFGFGFPDRVLYKQTKGGPLYVSRFLDSVWDNGISTVGDVTYDSAAYVARYVVKKVTGDAAEDHYWSVDERTGEMSVIHPEYATMSNRPGIGAGWLAKYASDVYPFDRLPVPGRGVVGRPPRIYDVWHERVDMATMEDVRAKRVEAIKRFDDKGPALRSVEVCAKARLKLKEKVL